MWRTSLRRPGRRAVHTERYGEAGSALLLFPAGILILLVLASLSFDLSLAFQRKRQLVELADAAANDAVTAGLDEVRLRADGRYCLDAGRVARSVGRSLEASELQPRVVQVRLITAPGAACPTGVAVTLAARTEYAFARAVPGMPAGAELEATGAATAVTR